MIEIIFGITLLVTGYIIGIIVGNYYKNGAIKKNRIQAHSDGFEEGFDEGVKNTKPEKGYITVAERDVKKVALKRYKK